MILLVMGICAICLGKLAILRNSRFICKNTPKKGKIKQNKTTWSKKKHAKWLLPCNGTINDMLTTHKSSFNWTTSIGTKQFQIRNLEERLWSLLVYDSSCFQHIVKERNSSLGAFQLQHNFLFFPWNCKSKNWSPLY